MCDIFRRSRVAFALIFGLVIPAMALAQATITGVVKDPSGAVLPGVTVEAASDALIEKVRAATTDATGEYRIIDLRPGAYVVTFTLPGFSSVKREGILLEGSFTATVNADLKVGEISETITIRGESPLVDVQSARRQMTVSNETINDLPTARAYAAYALLIPGIVVNGGVADVQATTGMVVFGGAGGRTNEGRVQVDGLSVGTPAGGAGVSLYNADLSNASELAITTSGGMGEAEVGGPVINVVPKTGGNKFSGTVFGSGTPENFVGSNYTDELKAAGLAAPGKYLKIWDYNAGLGGPIKRDRVWFFGNIRFQGAYQSVTGLFANKNAGDPTKFLNAPDTTRQGIFANSFSTGSVRVTVQASARHKFNVFWDEQIPCNGGGWSDDGGCRGLTENGGLYVGGFSGTIANAPEASTYNDHHQRVRQLTWSSPMSNRLLLEAGYGDFVNPWGQFGRPGSPVDTLISVMELCSAGCPDNGGIPQRYRSPAGPGTPVDWFLGQYNWRGSASYITGGHSLKVGYQGVYMNNREFRRPATEFGGNLGYIFQNGRPFQLTQDLKPTTLDSRMHYDAIYAQDQWQVGRITLQGALRYDHAWTNYPDQQLGPTRFLAQPILFPASKGVNYHDLSPRAGAAMDLFGTGNTALRMNVGRYLQPVSTVYPYLASNPMTRLAGGTTMRNWTDNDQDFFPDCDLGLVTAQSPLTTGSVDTCGALNNQFFGTSRFTNSFDPDMLTGLGVRPSDWSLGFTIQQKLASNISFEAGYFRRWLGNFMVIENALVSAADFIPFEVAVPTDPRLGSDSGKTLTGLYTVPADKGGLADSTHTQASKLGDVSQHFNGFNLTVTARPRNGLTFQGGLNTGKTIQDNCDVRGRVPEVQAGTTPAPETSTVNPYCHIDGGFVTRVTGLGSYVVPKVDVLISATFRSDQGQLLQANQTGVRAPVGQAFLGLSTATINYITPGSRYGDRVNELDFNFSKLLRFNNNRQRAKIGVDIYNIMNTNPVLAYNLNYAPPSVVGAGAWLAPRQVLTPRYVKLNVQYDF